MKKIIGVTSFVALSLATLFFASHAQAVGSVDQQVNYTLGWYSCFDNTYNKGQTFTPSTSGNLDRISAVLAKDGSPGTITMYVYASSGGYPTGTVLGSASMPDSSFSSRGSGTPTSTNFDFSSPIAVTAGTQYIFYFDAPSAITSMGFPMSINNNYCWYNEQNVLTSETSATKSSGSWGSLSNDDFDFATYISLAASPSASVSSSSSASASASATPSGSATSASLASTGSSPVPLLTAAMLVSAGAVVAAVSFVVRRKRS